MSVAPPDLYYDPYNFEIDADPHPIWKRMRDEAPCYYNEQLGFYALSRFADVYAASLDWQTYSSARGTVLEMIDTSPGARLEDEREYGLMIFMDPPRHDDFRRLVSRAFTPRRVSDLEGRTHELCALFLDPLRDASSFDFVEELAAKVPTMLIGALLGVPSEDQNQLRIWGDLMMRYEPDGLSAEKSDAYHQFSNYLDAMIADRRARPRDDMISDLLAAEITLSDGTIRRLDISEVLSFFSLLQLAGSETTARLLGWAAVLLARHPEQRATLVRAPAIIPNAVEELLRYEPPSPIQARFVTRDAEWHGVTVPANSKIAMLTGSAGRDEREFPDGDRFDVKRDFDRHVSFGYGVHFCLGASLARLEGRIVLEETLARFPEWHVDEREVEMVHTSTVRGPAHVPIHV
jgi:cytochrome P450